MSELIRQLFLSQPAQALGYEIDRVFMIVFWISLVLFAIVAGGIFIFVWKYAKRPGRTVSPFHGHHPIVETLWTVIPTIIVIIIFVIGFHPFMDARVAPVDAMEIQVTGKQWLWEFEYPNGIRTINELHVPVGQNIRLVMTSQDVIHSLYIPDMRVKMDVLPNRYTDLWFAAEQPGEHVIFCTEYCGRGHSDMLARLFIHDQKSYEEWLETGGDIGKNMPLEEYGALLYRTRGCETCHSIDGTPRECPTFKGLFGHEVKLADGSTVIADENYIRESILDPNAKIVAGYRPVMPSFQGLLREREIQALIAFIKAQQ